MLATVVMISVKPEYIDKFIEATKINQANSRKEEGNIRFDFLHVNDNTPKFILYEVYSDEVSAKRHKETAHYLTWKETVAPMMAEPRRGIPTTPLAFD